MSEALAGARALLIDLDGVLYVEDEAIAGAREAVGELREARLGLRFVTNTTARSRPETLAKLSRLGFDVAEEELVTPAALARRHCTQAGHRRVALIMNEEVKGDFEGLEETDDGPDAVIMGDLGEAFGFAILNRAFRMVMDGGELVALQKNRFWLTGEGLSLDAGPFVAAIEYATGRDAVVVGKPSASFFELVLEDAGVSADGAAMVYATGKEAIVVGKPSASFFDLVLGDLGVAAPEAAMVGDDVESDIGGALGAGLRAVLVRTGKYREDFVAGSGIEPTATVDSIADVPALLAS